MRCREQHPFRQRLLLARAVDDRRHDAPNCGAVGASHSMPSSGDSNVDTRLRKVEAGEYDAVMLAKAGLDRLGWAHRISETLSPDVCMPAVGQGALAVECRASDVETSDALEKLNDAETRAAIVAERTLLAALQGGCQVPLGAWARIERDELVLDACVCSIDGLQYVKQRATAPPDQARVLGERMAKLLIEAGAQNILEEVSRQRG